MEHAYKIDESKQIIFVTITGNVHEKEASVVGILMRMKAIELNYGLLFDFRLSTNHITVGQAYFWFDRYYDAELKKVKTVHLINQSDYHFFEFVQTTSKNRGAKLKVFTNEAEAIEWLGKKE
jgi:hypothetical protein